MAKLSRPASKRAAKPSSKPKYPKPAPARRTLHVLSDAAGNLPRHMLIAFLTQFPVGTFQVIYKPFLRKLEHVEQALAACDPAGSIVLHAVVAAASKRLIEGHCKSKRIPSRDLTGGFVRFLSDASGVPACEDVRKLHEVDDDYKRRVKALEFTLEHDDGLGLETINEADLILTGISRTSKTPTSIYLSQQHGLKVANVALAMAVAPPPELLAAPKEKVVGLLIDPAQLARIRTRRNAEWKMGGTSYNDEQQVEEEVRWSRRLFNRQGWATIDVTNRAIEETAARIVAVWSTAGDGSAGATKR
jgi:regulator of PEP synthase PpsR (kinase-PPPase family)